MTTLRMLLQIANGLYRDAAAETTLAQNGTLSSRLSPDVLEQSIRLEKMGRYIYRVHLEGEDSTPIVLYSRRRAARS